MDGTQIVVFALLGMMNIAIFVTGLLMMTNVDDMIRRIADPRFPRDAVVYVSLAGSVDMRVCLQGRVPFECSCCHCDNAATSHSGTLHYNFSSYPPAAHAASDHGAHHGGGQQQQNEQRRGALVLDETVAPIVQPHPESVCPCGVQDYYWSKCAEDTSLLAGCPTLKENLSKVGHAALACGIVGIILFVEYLVGIYCMFRYWSKYRWLRVCVFVAHLALFAAALGLSIRALPTMYTDLLNCPDCCPNDPKMGSLSSQGFTMVPTTRNSCVALCVFASIAALATLALLIFELVRGSPTVKPEDVPRADDTVLLSTSDL